MSLTTRINLAVTCLIACLIFDSEPAPGVVQSTAWAIIASVAGAAISGAASASSNRKAEKNRQNAQSGASAYLKKLRGSGSAYLAEAFGSKLNPEEFLYNPVDLTQSQLDTISGNLRAIPGAVKIQDKVNPAIWRNDTNRIRNLMPGFDAARDSYVGTMTNLQNGQLPFSDVQDLISTRASGSGVLASPGGSRNATLRDLGMGRMDAMREGNSMFGNFVQIAQQISPVERQFNPQQMLFTPQQRAESDIQQASLEQAGRASAELARAMPNPAENALVNAQMALNSANVGNPGNGSSAWSSALNILGGAVSSYGAARSMQSASGGGDGWGGYTPQGWMNSSPGTGRFVSQRPSGMPAYYGGQPAGNASFTNSVNAATLGAWDGSYVSRAAPPFQQTPYSYTPLNYDYYGSGGSMGGPNPILPPAY
jgi:hypothetical protein